MKKITETQKKSLLKPANNKVTIEIGYNSKFIMSSADALMIMDALSRAERIDEADYSNPMILPLDDAINTKIVAESVYLEMKMSQLLGITYSEYKESLNGSE